VLFLHYSLKILSLYICLSIFDHICQLPRNTPACQALHLSIEAFTGVPPSADWKRLPRRLQKNWFQQIEEDMGLPVTVPASLQVWIARCGDRYDSQLVKCSSERVCKTMLIGLRYNDGD